MANIIERVQRLTLVFSIYIVVPNEPEYYLSISEFPVEPYISYVCEETGTMYEEADLSEVIGLKIVSWDFEVNSK